jgi:RNA polymerase sigma factor (sigma-70 family)
VHLYGHERDPLCCGPVMDGEEIIALYDRHARELVGFFVRRTRDPQLALDLLGDTFLAAFEQRRRCRAANDDQRSAWLYRIAANKLAAHYRRGASERRATERFASHVRALSGAELEAMQTLADRSQFEDLSAALDALSADQRLAVRLRVIDERPYAAVSAELGVSEAAARARVSRGLRALRRAIAGEPERSGNEQS